MGRGTFPFSFFDSIWDTSCLLLFVKGELQLCKGVIAGKLRRLSPSGEGGGDGDGVTHFCPHNYVKRGGSIR